MGKKIGLDTSVWIYALEENPKFLATAKSLLRKIEVGKFIASFSVIGMVEILTGPKLLGQYELAEQYKHLISSFPNLEIIGVNERVVDLASALRAEYGIKTPDAIHIATAIDFQADIFFCNDKSLLKVKEIKIKMLE